MAPIVREILERHFSDVDGDWSPLRVAAALHFYVYQVIPYELRHEGGTRPFREPHETWRKGGNCEEKTVTLTSLYDAVKTIHTRMVAVENRTGEGHLLVEMGTETPRSDVESELDAFYEDLGSVYDSVPSGKRRYYVTSDDSRSWLLSDPEMSHHIGDGNSLRRQEYLRGTRLDWQWTTVRYYVYPDVGRVRE